MKEKLFALFNRIKTSRWANKYFILIASFSIFVLFFDANSAIKRMSVKRDNRQLRKEIQEYRDKIESDSVAIDLLKSNPSNLEQFARDKYNVTKKNEDVYIIKE